MSSGDLVTVPGYIAGTWTADPIHSEIGFSVRHMMVSKVRGKFKAFEATIVTGDDPIISSATATIEMASIDTGNEGRDEDLRSSGYFGVEEHPQMSFTSTGVRSDGGAILVDGDLTIRGITNPVTLTVELGGFGPDPFGGTRAGFSATTHISRSEFGITSNAVLETGGVMVSDRVDITLDIEAVLQQG